MANRCYPENHRSGKTIATSACVNEQHVEPRWRTVGARYTSRVELDRGYVAAFMSAAPETPLFGTVERRLFRVTAVLFAILAMIVLISGMIWILGIALSFFYNLIMPLCVAGILALVLYPVVNYLSRRVWLNRIAATTIVVSLFVAAIAGFIVLVVPALIREIVLFAEMVPGILARWQDFMVQHFPRFTRMVMETAQEGEVKQVLPGLGKTGQNVKSFAGALVGLSFVPLLLFFALLSGSHLHGRITEVLSVFTARTQKKIMYFIDVFLAQLTGFFQGQLVIAGIMGIMFAIGFSLIGLKGGDTNRPAPRTSEYRALPRHTDRVADCVALGLYAA